MTGHGLPRKAAPCEGRELGELIEAVVRPLLREQEQRLTRSVRAMFDEHRSASGEGPESPTCGPRPDSFELGVSATRSLELGVPRSPDRRARGVKSLEDARGREILLGMSSPRERPQADDWDPPFRAARSVEDMLALPGPRPAPVLAPPRGDGQPGGWPRASAALNDVRRRLASAGHRRAPRGGQPPEPPELLDLCGPVPACPGADAPPRGPRPRREPCGGAGLGGPRRGAPAQDDEERPGPPDLPGGLCPPSEDWAEAPGSPELPCAAGAGDEGEEPTGEADGVAAAVADQHGGARQKGAGCRVYVHLSREEVGAGRLGIDVLEATAGAERGLRVMAIHEDGLIAAWNAGRAEGCLRVGDVLVEINGQTEGLTSVLSQASAGGEPLDIVAAVPEGDEHPGASAARERGWAARVLALPAHERGSRKSSQGSEPTHEGAEPARRTSRGGSRRPPPRPDTSDQAVHGGGCQIEPLRRIDPACYNSKSSSHSLRRKGSNSSLGTPTMQTVRTVRHQREDGLVEAMVHDRDWLVSEGSFCTPDSLEAEGHLSAPLWLRICGTLPWSQPPAGAAKSSGLRCCYRPLVLASMALIICFLVFTAAYAPAGSCEREACLGYVQVADLTLAVGSLLGLLAMRSLSSLGILGSSESILVAYARRQEITAAWSAAMRGHSARLAFLWVCSVALRFASLMRVPRPSLLDAAMAGSHAVASLVFLGIVSGILHVSCALTMVIDSYATHFDSACFRLGTSVHEWNLLQAVLRKVSGAAERGFMAVQSTAVALVTGVILAARGQPSGEPVGAGDVAWLSSTALLVVGAILTFFKAAEVSERCMRMPSVINSLNFGAFVDARRHYLVEFISYSAAGFYVWEVRLTAAIALKLTYFCCILAFASLSQLYADVF